MSNKEVLWTDTAQLDLKEIVDHIAADSVTNALSVLDKLETKANPLFLHSNRGRIVPELADLSVNQYRELIEKPWRIIYCVKANRVFVVAVLDSRRDLSSVLLQRLTRE